MIHKEIPLVFASQFLEETSSSEETAPLKSGIDFQDMPFHPKLLQAIKACRYTTPTPIQQEAIPHILEGRDLMASAETGAGKTVAFVLPALQKLLTNPAPEGRGPRVLILTPTRELATQITESIAAMSKFANFRFGTITGGVGYPAQEQLLRQPVDLLVATPGRLMDHMERGRVDYSRLTLFILDEADRMLDMGFVQDMEHIAKSLPSEHQTLLFSATLEGSVQRIAKQFLQNPVRVQLTATTKKHALITQRVHLVDNFNHKRALLVHVLEDPTVWQAIVFTGTKRSADDLVEDLADKGIISAALHGDIKQNKRTRTLERMHRGQIRVLVATDVAARGLDIKKLSHVINFDLPRTAEDYIHRIGRTGRCGEKGIAISLAGPKDGGILAQIERVTGQKLQREVIPGFESRGGQRSESMSRGDRGDRSDRGDRGGRRERENRVEQRGARSEQRGDRREVRGVRGEQRSVRSGDRPARPEQSRGYSSSARGERFVHSDRSDRRDRPERLIRSERSGEGRSGEQYARAVRPAFRSNPTRSNTTGSRVESADRGSRSRPTIRSKPGTLSAPKTGERKKIEHRKGRSSRQSFDKA